MSDDKPIGRLAQDIFARKRERRRKLAALPVERKLEILLHLQQIAHDVALATGRTARQPWKLPR